MKPASRGQSRDGGIARSRAERTPFQTSPTGLPTQSGKACSARSSPASPGAAFDTRRMATASRSSVPATASPAGPDQSTRPSSAARAASVCSGDRAALSSVRASPQPAASRCRSTGSQSLRVGMCAAASSSGCRSPVSRHASSRSWCSAHDSSGRCRSRWQEMCAS